MSRGLARWDERAQRALPPLLVLAAFLKELGKEIPIARALIGVAERGSDEAFQAEVTTFLRTLVDLGQEQARQNSSLAEEIAGLATMIRDASGDREALLAWAEDSPQWGVTGDDLWAGLRAAAVISYQASLVLEYQDADYRGITDRSDEKDALLPLVEVFVPPALVAERTAGDDDERQRDLLAELDRVDSPDALEALERRWYEVTDGPLLEDPEVSATVSCWEAIGHARHVVVLGRAGSGKSTLTRFLAYASSLGAAAKSDLLGWSGDEVPVRVELSAFAQHRREGRAGASLRSFIDERLDERGGRLLREGMGEMFDRGDVLVLLDGLDEEPDPARRLGLAKAIDGFIIDHDKCRVVVTSRPKPGYVRLKGDLAHFDIATLTDPQVNDLVHRWRLARERRLRSTTADPARAVRDAEEDLAEITASPDILRLARTPLVLSLLLSLRTQNLRLPRQRIGVLDLLVRLLLGKWQAARSDAQVVDGAESDERDLLAVVAQVAFELRRDQPGFAFRTPVLERHLAKALKDQEVDTTTPERTASSYVAALTNRAGLLDERTTGWVAFWHLSFQEYLAAVHLATGTETTPAVLDLRAEASWRDVIIATASYIGHVQQDKITAGNLVLAIADENLPPEESLLHPMLQLAAAVAAADVNLRPSVMSQIVARLADAVNRFPTRALKATFIATARTIDAFVPDGPAVESLAAIAESPNGEVRMEAVRLLANAAPNNEAALAACRRAREDSAPNVAAHAALGLVLADTATKEDWGALLRATGLSNVHLDVAARLSAPDRTHSLVALLGDGNPEVRSRAARVLVGVGDLPGDAVVALVALLGDGNPGVRSVAAQVLGGVGDLPGDAVVALVALLGGDDPMVGSRAARVLVGVGDLPGDAVVALVALLGDDDPGVRSRAAQVLVGVGDLPGDAVVALVALLGDGNPGVRSRAAQVLVGVGDLPGDAVVALVALLGDGNPGVRSVAAQVLGGVGDLPGDAVVALVALLGDDDPVVRFRAAQVLGGVGDLPGDAVVALVALLGDDDPGMRLRAARVLVGVGDLSGDAVVALVALLGDDDPGVRSRAARVLVGVGDLPGDAVVALVALLGDDDPMVRWVAAQVLVGVGEHTGEAVVALVALLGDGNLGVGSRAAQVLGGVGDLPGDAVVALVALLGGDDPGVRLVASRVLGGVGDLPGEAVVALVALLGGDDPGVRLVASRVLGGVGDLPGDAVVALVALLGDGNPGVRSRAARVLVGVGEHTGEAVVALVALLADDNPFLRSRAAQVLGGVGDLPGDAVVALVALLGDDDPMVRLVAAQVLVGVGDLPGEAVVALVALLADDDPILRYQAAQVLGEQPGAVLANAGVLDRINEHP